MKSKGRKAVIKVLSLLVIAGFILLAWAVVCVLVRLITFCFGLPFDLKIATGVCGVCLLVRLTFHGLSEEK